MIAKFLFGMFETVPAVRDIFFQVQELYYNKLYSDLSIETNEKKGKRRALSNSIENANSDEDRKHLSIMLHELRSGGM